MMVVFMMGISIVSTHLITKAFTYSLISVPKSKVLMKIDSVPSRLPIMADGEFVGDSPVNLWRNEGDTIVIEAERYGETLQRTIIAEQFGDPVVFDFRRR